MGIRLDHFTLAVAAMLLTSGCASAGGSSSQLQSTVYSTHRMVQELSQNLSGTVTQLSTTTAELVARIGASDQEMRELLSVAQENQYKLERLQYSLDTLTATLYRHLNLSPPESSVPPAPSRPIGRAPTRGEIRVEPPLGQPQPDTVRPDLAPDTSAQEAQTVSEKAHFREARELYADENYVDALRHFEEHLSLFPDSQYTVDATYWRAHCRFKMGEYAEAISGFDEFREQFPDSARTPFAMYNQAVAYSRLGQNARAIELFQRLIREHPDDAATEGARGALRQLRSLN